jgi:alpha-N-arabinofuranosidase
MDGPEAELRAEAGSETPFDVTLWGLGNEVFGRWQVGYYRDPRDYALDVISYAQAMRQADPRLRFVVCGDSYKEDNTVWNREVLTPAVIEFADWVSYHSYTHLGCEASDCPTEASMHQLIALDAQIRNLVRLNSP